MNKTFTYDFLYEFNKYEEGGNLKRNMDSKGLHPVFKEFRNILVHSQELVYSNFTDYELVIILEGLIYKDKLIPMKIYNKITELGFNLVINKISKSTEYKLINTYKGKTRTKKVFLEKFEFENIQATFSEKIEPLVIKLKKTYIPNLIEAKKIPEIDSLIRISIAYPSDADVINVTGKWYIISEVDYHTGSMIVTFFKNIQQNIPLKFEIRTSLYSENEIISYPFYNLELERKIQDKEDIYREIGKSELKKIIKFIKSNYNIIFNNYYNLFI